MSKRPAPIRTIPAQRNLPAANRNAAQMLMSSPMNVRTLGWTLDNASALTIPLMIGPKMRPTTPVKVMPLLLEFVDGQQFQNLQLFRAARRLHFHRIAD